MGEDIRGGDTYRRSYEQAAALPPGMTLPLMPTLTCASVSTVIIVRLRRIAAVSIIADAALDAVNKAIVAERNLCMCPVSRPNLESSHRVALTDDKLLESVVNRLRGLFPSDVMQDFVLLMF